MHSGTDLTTLLLPPEARAALATPRVERIHAHSIHVPTVWWNTALTQRNLPGGPLTGESEEAGGTTISRSYLFSLAINVEDDEDVLKLLWHVLAWGSGSKLRHNHHRLDGIKEHLDTAITALREAARLARTYPEAAYRRLRPRRGTQLPYLGPSFFTKYLYFVGGGSITHPCVILDSRVANTLNQQCGWTSLHSGGPWLAETYQRYCSLLARWAKEESEDCGRQVCPDEIERWLFDV